MHNFTCIINSALLRFSFLVLVASWFLFVMRSISGNLVVENRNSAGWQLFVLSAPCAFFAKYCLEVLQKKSREFSPFIVYDFVHVGESSWNLQQRMNPLKRNACANVQPCKECNSGLLQNACKWKSCPAFVHCAIKFIFLFCPIEKLLFLKGSSERRTDRKN